MRRARRAATAAVSLAALLGGSLLAWVALRDRPQDLPWTRLDLDQPIGIFTGRKLAGLIGDAIDAMARTGPGAALVAGDILVVSSKIVSKAEYDD